MTLLNRAPEDLKIALGQCFWIGLNGTIANDPATIEIFKRFQPGGTILFQRNVESIEQVKKFNDDLQKRSLIPVFTAVDQEGGTVERLYQLIGSVPPAMALAAAQSKRLIRRVHFAHARLLTGLGFNVNFTPVLDLALSTADNGLGTRCFSDDPNTVIRCAHEVIRAHRKAGVLVSGKHFPGLGDTDCDSHLALPTVSRVWKQLEKEDLKPYRKLLDELPLVMVNHALYPEKNKHMPASLAPEIVHNVLVKKWNYSGLSISDDLIMGAVSNLYNVPEAAEKALLAGNHLFLICKPEGVVKAYERILARAKRNRTLSEAIFRSSSRILSFKFQHLKTRYPKIDFPKEMELLEKYGARVSEQSVTLLCGVPARGLPEECTVYLPKTRWIQEKGNAIEDYLTAAGTRVSSHYYPVNLAESESTRLAAKSRTTTNIVVTANASIQNGQKQLLQQLLDRDKSVNVISGSYPVEPLPEGIKIVIATYWTSPAALEKAVKVLFGEKKPSGKLPLHLTVR
jgi:beta-N-acetylhexosaminidase